MRITIPLLPLSMVVCASLVMAAAASAQALQGLPATLQFRSELTAGHYACRDGDRWTNQFDVIDGHTYQLRAVPPVAGRLSYDPASSTINWQSGPFSSTAEDTTLVTGYTTTRIEDGIPVILIHFEDPAYGASTEYCARLPE